MDNEQQAVEAPQEAVPEWVGTMEQRFDQLESRMGELVEEPETDLGAQLRPEPEFEDEPEVDLAYEPDDYEDLTPEQAETFLNQRIQAGIEERIGPIAAQVKQITEAEFDREVENLQSKYPELKDPEKATEVVNYAQAFFTKLGAPQLAATPQAAELVYQALQGQKHAASEIAAGATDEQAASIESGGGAQAAADQASDDAIGDAIVGASKKATPW